MATSLGSEYFDFCGGEKCFKLIDMANKMIERYKVDKTNLYKEMEDMEKEFKDKEEYIDHLRKKRSDLEKEVRFFKEKVERKLRIWPRQTMMSWKQSLKLWSKKKFQRK